MAVSIDIAGLISGTVTGLFDSAVIIGLPTIDAPVPSFCLCEIPDEHGRASVRLPGNLTQAGEFRARTVIEASTMELDIVLSDIPASKDQSVFRAIQVACGKFRGYIWRSATEPRGAFRGLCCIVLVGP